MDVVGCTEVVAAVLGRAETGATGTCLRPSEEVSVGRAHIDVLARVRLYGPGERVENGTQAGGLVGPYAAAHHGFVIVKRLVGEADARQEAFRGRSQTLRQAGLRSGQHRGARRAVDRGGVVSGQGRRRGRARVK